MVELTLLESCDGLIKLIGWGLFGCCSELGGALVRWSWAGTAGFGMWEGSAGAAAELRGQDQTEGK